MPVITGVRAPLWINNRTAGSFYFITDINDSTAVD